MSNLVCDYERDLSLGYGDVKRCFDPKKPRPTPTNPRIPIQTSCPDVPGSGNSTLVIQPGEKIGYVIGLTAVSIYAVVLTAIVVYLVFRFKSAIFFGQTTYQPVYPQHFDK